MTRKLKVVTSERACGCVSVPVEIVEPISRHSRVRTGSIVVLKCRADVSTTIRWYLNSTQLPGRGVGGVYVLTSVDRQGGVATSHLELAPVRRQHAGRYSCRSLHDPSDNDTVVLTVTNRQLGKYFTLSLPIST